MFLEVSSRLLLSLESATVVRYTVYHPFGLMPLLRRGQVAIAVDLDQHRTHGQAKKEWEIEPVVVEDARRKEGNSGPVCNEDKGKQACPTRLKLPIGKHIRAKHDAGVAKRTQRWD